MSKQKKLDVVRLEIAAGRLRALAHPMRIAIIDMLTSNPKMSVTEIYERLGIEQAAASHHLNILKNKGILVSRRDGKKIYYSLKNDALLQIVDCLDRCDTD